ncbi:uncharacterized protein LOC124194239 [Daphnia pulex]|uniref:uncharacterized protein LOC124194239 n=1 Tax=Daphnia pulex TaxID=6669 RepID=UPI001EDCE375|nr:uncharacterized protein LOC124194239 [Daphnia pulex]XP_046444283.1 uncharacterized protein LOC124194239 [Daphnia pulex]
MKKRSSVIFNILLLHAAETYREISRRRLVLAVGRRPTDQFKGRYSLLNETVVFEIPVEVLPTYTNNGVLSSFPPWFVGTDAISVSEASASGVSTTDSGGIPTSNSGAIPASNSGAIPTSNSGRISADSASDEPASISSAKASTSVVDSPSSAISVALSV